MSASSSTKFTSPDDIELVIAEETIHCSKSRLINISSYFSGMFNSKMKEAVDGSKPIIIRDSDSKCFQMLYNFDPEDLIPLKYVSLLKLLEVALYFQFNNACSKLTNLIIDRLNISNAVQIYMFTDQFYIPVFCETVLNFILWFINEISDTENFAQFPISLLCKTLKMDELNCKSVMDVLTVIIKYLNTKNNVSHKQCLQLFECVHKDSISQHYYATLHNSVKNQSYHTWLREYFNIYPRVSTKSVVSTFSRKINLYLLYDVTFQSKSENSEAFSDLNMYKLILGDSQKSNLVSLTSRREPLDLSSSFLSKSMVGSAFVEQGVHLYIVGGEFRYGYGAFALDMVMFDSIKLCWYHIGKLNKPRRHHSMVFYRNSLIVLGGFGKYRCMLNTVDSFSLDTKTWTSLPDLLEPSYLNSICVHNERIYAIKSIIQYYDYVSPIWTRVSIDFPAELAPFQCLLIDEVIYICSRETDVAYRLDFDQMRSVESEYSDQTFSSSRVYYDAQQRLVIGVNSDTDGCIIRYYCLRSKQVLCEFCLSIHANLSFILPFINIKSGIH